jgi:hypothetical protein
MVGKGDKGRAIEVSFETPLLGGWDEIYGIPVGLD